MGPETQMLGVAGSGCMGLAGLSLGSPQEPPKNCESGIQGSMVWQYLATQSH